MLISYGSFPECGDKCGCADVRMIVGELVEIRYITRPADIEWVRSTASEGTGLVKQVPSI